MLQLVRAAAFFFSAEKSWRARFFCFSAKGSSKSIPKLFPQAQSRDLLTLAGIGSNIGNKWTTVWLCCFRWKPSQSRLNHLTWARYAESPP